MRIAVIADVHGNVFALEAVLNDLQQHSPDVTVDLGDCVSGPLRPFETAELLMSRQFLTVRGNHDRIVTGPRAEMGRHNIFSADRINERHTQWLKNLPLTAEIAGEVQMCHGTPDSDSDYLLETIDNKAVRLAEPAQVDQRLGGETHAVVLCAHSHVPRVVWSRRGQLIVNPGSVGLPAYFAPQPEPHAVDTGNPYARYALLDRNAGRWNVTLCAVAYDWDNASAEAARVGASDWAQALATGYALRP